MPLLDAPTAQERRLGKHRCVCVCVQNYVFALRACLKEMELDASNEYTLLEKLAYLTRDLVSRSVGSHLLILLTRVSGFITSIHSISQILVRDPIRCALVQGILARCMQSTSNVPLWRLYAKQECCRGPSSDLEYERELLVTLLLLPPYA